MAGFFCACALAPGFASAAERVIFHPGWFPSAQLAGVFVAFDEGFYREAGLAVEIEPFAFGQDSPAAIDAQPGVCALGTTEGYILLQKRGHGADLKALAAMLQESPAGYMSLAPTGINQVRDFSGRRVGIHKFAEPLARWFIRQAGLDPASVRMQFVDDDVTLLLHGDVDVMQGYFTEEFTRVQELSHGAGRFISFTSLGFPSYSEVLYTTGAQVQAHAAALRRFVEATRRGWAFAFAHPDAALQAVGSRLPATTDLLHLRQALVALQPYVCPGGQPPLERMDPAKWKIVQQAGVEIGLISHVEPADTFLLNW